MIPTLVTCVLVILALGGCVVASMFVEERANARRLRRADAERAAEAPHEWFDESADPELAAPDITLADAPHETTVVIPGSASADAAVAVLLAAYVASGGESARRAAAWVTAAASPPSAGGPSSGGPSSGGPSLEGPSFVPGADLRGRTVAVRRLLEHDQDDRCWVTLRAGVDIARGVDRHPITCPTLDALVGLWAATRAAVSAVPHDELARMVAAIDELDPTWTATTGAAVVEPVAEQLRAAAVGGGSARIHVRLTPLCDGDAVGAATSAPEVHETV